MCGIFGSPKIERVKDLYSTNFERGTFSSSVVCLEDVNKQQVIRAKGKIDIEDSVSSSNGVYFIGHTQAPTSAKRNWDPETSHPFTSTSWSVVHNGVLTNHHDILHEYSDNNLFDKTINPVDTSIIPKLLQYFTESQEDGKERLTAPEIIKATLNKLQGTFAVAIVDTDCNDVYIARQGSILHYNDNGEFSTMGGKGLKVLPEGTIMMLRDYTTWKVVDTFTTRSPFLFL
jgi:glucosamine 6-phosphate synthetase-like amidotransferase/phosphosugar isomerase protein